MFLTSLSALLCAFVAYHARLSRLSSPKSCRIRFVQNMQALDKSLNALLQIAPIDGITIALGCDHSGGRMEQRRQSEVG